MVTGWWATPSGSPRSWQDSTGSVQRLHRQVGVRVPGLMRGISQRHSPRTKRGWTSTAVILDLAPQSSRLQGLGATREGRAGCTG